MNIQTLINNAKKKKDLVAIDIFNKILNILYIKIFKFITYYKLKYNKLKKLNLYTN